VLLPGSPQLHICTLMLIDLSEKHFRLHLLSLCSFVIIKDPKALREEGQVSVWRCEFWSARDPTPHHPSPQEEVNVQPRLSPASSPRPSLFCEHGSPCNSPVWRRYRAYLIARIVLLFSSHSPTASPTPLTALFLMCMCT